MQFVHSFITEWTPCMQFGRSFITEWTPCIQFGRSFITEWTSCMQFGRSVITEGFTGIPAIPSVMQDFNVVYTTSIFVMTEGIARVTVNTYTIVCVLAADVGMSLPRREGGVYLIEYFLIVWDHSAARMIQQ